MNEVVSNLTFIFKGDKTDHDEYEAVLSSLNLKCHPIPVLSFEFCNVKEAKERLFSPSRYRGLILTSPRAVESLAKIICQNTSEWSDAKLQWMELKVFTVGETTSILTETLLGLKTLGKESGNAEELASFIIKDVGTSCANKPFFFPCGNLKRETLPKILGDAAMKLDSVVVYKTTSHPLLEETLKDATRDGLPEFLIYFSPSGVKFTMPVFEKLKVPIEKCKAVAIGPTTADALKSIGLRVAGVAAKPNPSSLAEIVATLRC